MGGDVVRNWEEEREGNGHQEMTTMWEKKIYFQWKGDKRERYQDCKKAILKMREIFLHHVFDKRFYPKELCELIKRRVTQFKNVQAI